MTQFCCRPSIGKVRSSAFRVLGTSKPLPHYFHLNPADKLVRSLSAGLVFIPRLCRVRPVT